MKLLTKPYCSTQQSLMAAFMVVAFAPLTASATALDDCYKRTQWSYSTGGKTQEKAWNLLLDGKKKSKTFDADGSLAKENGIAKRDLNAAKAAIGPAVNAVGDPVVKNRAEYDALDQKKAAACKTVEEGKLAAAATLANTNYSKVKMAFDAIK